MSITKKIPLDVSLYMRLRHQELKLPICTIRGDTQKQTILEDGNFSNNFCHFNLNNKETLLSCS